MKSNPGPPMTVGNAAKAEHWWAIISRLPSTPLGLPFILCLRISLRLPLHVRDRISTAAGERQDVVLDVTGARASRATGRRARVRQLELALTEADRGCLAEAEPGRTTVTANAAAMNRAVGIG